MEFKLKEKISSRMYTFMTTDLLSTAATQVPVESCDYCDKEVFFLL